MKETLSTSPTGSPPLSQTRIFDAAEAIVQSRGVAGLTLAAAARDAGISKGGLLYHFASKEALLDALLRRLAGFLEQEYIVCVAAVSWEISQTCGTADCILKANS
jgi:AcrR family transcriptional regulator